MMDQVVAQSVASMLAYGPLGVLFVLAVVFVWRWVLPRADKLVSALTNLIVTLNERIPMQCAKLDDLKSMVHESNDGIKKLVDATHNQTGVLASRLETIAIKQDTAATALVKSDSKH